MLWIIGLLSIIGFLGFPLLQWLSRFIVKLLCLSSKGIAVVGCAVLLWLIGFKGLIVLICTLVIILVISIIKFLSNFYRKIPH